MRTVRQMHDCQLQPQNRLRPRLGSNLVAALPLTLSGPLFFPPSEILESIARLGEPAAGTGRLLRAEA